MAVRLSASGTSHPSTLYLQENSWYSFLFEVKFDPRAIVWLE
jgi:hypothetical protein